MPRPDPLHGCSPSRAAEEDLRQREGHRDEQGFPGGGAVSQPMCRKGGRPVEWPVGPGPKTQTIARFGCSSSEQFLLVDGAITSIRMNEQFYAEKKGPNLLVTSFNFRNYLLAPKKPKNIKVACLSIETSLSQPFVILIDSFLQFKKKDVQTKKQENFCNKCSLHPIVMHAPKPLFF